MAEPIYVKYDTDTGYMEEADEIEDALVKVKHLEDLVLHLSYSLSHLMLHYGMDHTYPASRREELKDRREQYKNYTRSELMAIPDKLKAIPFCKISGERGVPGIKGYKPGKKVANTYSHQMSPMSTRVVNLIFRAGYETMGDLNGVPFAQIFSIPHFGPAAIKEFLQFLNRHDVDIPWWKEEHKK